MNPTDFIRRAIQNSPWLVIAFLLHALLAAMFSIIYVKQHFEKKRDEVTAIAVAQQKVAEPEAVIEPPEPPDRKSLPKDQEAEIVTFEEDIYIPNAEQQPDEDLHLDRGDPSALDNLPSAPSGGTAIGVGERPGHHGNAPSAYVGRTAGQGGGFGRGGGQTEATEKAVLDGLRWLLRHQNDDGSFGAASCGLHCTSVTPCVSPELGLNANHDEGLTGLALLCFLGAGWSSDSRQNIVDTQMGKRYFVGPTIKKGLLWLAQIQDGNGAFAVEEPNMYNQSLATMAMCEAYALSGNKTWKGYAEKGLHYLVQAQKVNPKGTGLWGWRYHSRQDLDADSATGEAQGGNYAFELSDSDTSVTCWAAMALKSAELAEINFPAESYAGALGFVRWVSTENGLAGYQDPQTAGMTVQGFRDFYVYHPGTMSALSMCVRTFVTKDISDPYLEAAAKQIIKDLPVVTQDKLSIDYYYWYYATLALNQFDGPDSPRSSGKYWKPWNEALVPVLLGLQDQTPTPDDCSHGGWLTEDRWSYAGGPMYTTAISILTLEVYYRFANAFGTAKAEKKPSVSNQPDKPEKPEKK